MSATGKAVDPAQRPQATSALKRYVLIALGFTFVAIGFVGVFVPLLPTTSFMILALWCFARSSARFEAWLLDLKVIGPMLQDYRAGLGMPRRAKGIAITTMVAFAGISAVLLREYVWAVALIVALIAIGAWYITRRVPTRELVLAERGLATHR